MNVRLAVLGPVTVEVKGRPVTLSAARERAVLGMLGLRVGRPVTVDQLIDALWGNEPPPNARKAVQTYVARVRKNLTPDAIESRGNGYVLTLDSSEVDAYQFASLAKEGRAELASGGHARAASLLTDALALWRGPVLEEVDESGWVEGERVSLEELRRVVEEDLIDAKLQLGEHATVAADAERAVAAEPLRERRWGQLMLALYRSSRQADALRAYQRCRDVLIDQLGVEPGVDLRELEQAILDQSPTISAPSGVSPWRALLPTGLPAALAEAAERPFVGRSELVAELEHAWHDVRHGGRATVLLCGEPGAGKTRLAAAVAENVLESGGAVLCGRSHPELALPFQPFAEALAPLARDAQPGSAGAIVAGLSAGFDTSEPVAESRNMPEGQAIGQFRIFEAVARLLAGAAGSQPLLLVVEDLHWATTATLRLLRYLATAPELRGVMVLGTLRDTEGSALAVLGDIAGTRRLTVGPMTTDEVAALAAGRGVVDGDVVAKLHELAGGNPFLVDQLLLDFEAGELFSDAAAPRRGADVVTGRLTRLSAQTRSVLELAAVAGDEFELPVLAAAHQTGQEGALDALEEAETAGLVVATPESKGRFRFRHAVVRRALTSGLPETRRMRFHRALAEALEQAASEPARLGMLARHCAEAAPLGLGGRAVEYARRAGELSRANFAFEEAAEYFDVAVQATRFLDEQDLGLRCDLLTAKGEALRRGGDASGGAALREAAALARRLDDPLRLAHVALSFTGTAAYAYDISGAEPDSVQMASDAEAALGDAEPALRARLLASIAVQVLYADSEGARRPQLLDESVRLAREAGDARVLVDVLVSQLLAWIDPADLVGRMRVAEEAVSVAESLGDAEIAERANYFLSLAQVEAGDLDAYTRTHARVRELVSALHQPALEAELLFNDASDRFMAGDLAGAERLVQDARVLAQRGGLPEANLVGFPAACLGAPYWVAGRLAELKDTYQALAQMNPLSPWGYILPLVHHQAGDPERGRAVFDQLAAQEFDDVPLRLIRVLMLSIAAQVATEFDDVPRAKLLLEHMMPLEGRVIAPQPIRWDLADRNLGRLYMTIGEYDTAKDFLGRAADQSRRLGAPFFLAWTLADLARLLTLTGDAAGAREHADAAIATAEPLGAHAIVAAAERAIAGI